MKKDYGSSRQEITMGNKSYSNKNKSYSADLGIFKYISVYGIFSPNEADSGIIQAYS